jgi:hypothetical protein
MYYNVYVWGVCKAGGWFDYLPGILVADNIHHHLHVSAFFGLPGCLNQQEDRATSSAVIA